MTRRNIRQWRELAYQAIVAVARTQATVHANDLARTFKIEPDHPNAWGAVWSRAIREGVITRVGEYRHCIDPKKHKHVSPVYRSLVWRGPRCIK